MWGSAVLGDTRWPPNLAAELLWVAHGAWASGDRSFLLRPVALGCFVGMGSKAGLPRGTQRGWQVTGLSPGPFHNLEKL